MHVLIRENERDVSTTERAAISEGKSSPSENWFLCTSILHLQKWGLQDVCDLRSFLIHCIPNQKGLYSKPR